MQKVKTALVTGSSSGIGMGIAERLLENGYRVVLHGLSCSESEKNISALKIKGEVVGFKNVDLSSADAINAMCNELNKDGIEIDVLVNNAGFQHVANIEDFDPAVFDKLIKVNLTAAFLLIHNLIPKMQKNGWGRIINIASAHGLVASKGKSAYVASKHGILGLTKVVGLENATKGITCNAICPGWVLTPLVQKQIEDRAAAQGISVAQAKSDLLLEKQPSGEFVTPNQIGGLVNFLCSEDAMQITGTSISIDGGWTAQ